MRILIADDEEIERTALSKIIAAHPGHEIVFAGNGQEVLDQLLDGPKIHLCMLDIRMPEIDGLTLLQRIRRDEMLRTLYVVITSSNRDRGVILTLAQLGISGYLLKPYDPAKVMAVVGQVEKLVTPEEAKANRSSRDLLRRTLLVVEDDAQERAVIRDCAALESGWTVVEAENGEQALSLLQGGLRPNLCFLDIRMPRMDGIAFLQQARQLVVGKVMPVVIISAEQSSTNVKQLAELGITSYIVKPFDLSKLRNALLTASESVEVG